jgi:sec-independent protein translocase protein TatC
LTTEESARKVRRGKTASNPDGRMPIVEHLREFRGRLIKSLAAVGIGSIVGFAFYDQIVAFAQTPMDDVKAALKAHGYDVTLTIQGGVTSAFSLQLKIAFLIGLALAAPVWIYQLWRFVTPGLHRHEKRYAIWFVLAAVPLFILGMAFAWIILPSALRILLGFTPHGVVNLQGLDQYLTFIVQLTVVFGIGFLTPVFIVALNFVGVLPASLMLRNWRWIVLGCSLFGAVATPTGDPLTLTYVTVPVLALMYAGIGIAWLHDRRKPRSLDDLDYSSLSDDDASPIEAPRPITDSDEVT